MKKLKVRVAQGQTNSIHNGVRIISKLPVILQENAKQESSTPSGISSG